MGVKGLWRLLLPIGRRISIETLEGRILAIDASIWLTQFLTVASKQKDLESQTDSEGGFRRCYSYDYLVGFLRRLCKLRFQGVRPILVFDGATPEIKKQELRLRAKKRKLGGSNARNADSFAHYYYHQRRNGSDATTDAPDNHDEWVEATRRAAKRILAQQLKAGKWTASGAGNKRLKTKMGAPVVPNSKNIGTATVGTSYAPGFYDPDAKTNTNDQIATAIDRSNKEDKITHQPRTKVHKNETDNTNDCGFLQEDYSSNSFREEVNDWDAPIVDQDAASRDENGPQSSNGGSPSTTFGVSSTSFRKRKPFKNYKSKSIKDVVYDTSEYHAGDGTAFKVDSVAALPEHARKDIIEDAQKQRRLASRREFMKVASNPEGLSSCQLSNFLKSTRLNRDIAKMAQTASSNQETKGMRQTSILFEKNTSEARPVRGRRHESRTQKNSAKSSSKRRMLRTFHHQKTWTKNHSSTDDETEHDFRKPRNNHYLSHGIQRHWGEDVGSTLQDEEDEAFVQKYIEPFSTSSLDHDCVPEENHHSERHNHGSNSRTLRIDDQSAALQESHDEALARALQSIEDENARQLEEINHSRDGTNERDVIEIEDSSYEEEQGVSKRFLEANDEAIARQLQENEYNGSNDEETNGGGFLPSAGNHESGVTLAGSLGNHSDGTEADNDAFGGGFITGNDDKAEPEERVKVKTNKQEITIEQKEKARGAISVIDSTDSTSKSIGLHTLSPEAYDAFQLCTNVPVDVHCSRSDTENRKHEDVKIDTIECKNGVKNEDLARPLRSVIDLSNDEKMNEDTTRFPNTSSQHQNSYSSRVTGAQAKIDHQTDQSSPEDRKNLSHMRSIETIKLDRDKFEKKHGDDDNEINSTEKIKSSPQNHDDFESDEDDDIDWEDGETQAAESESPNDTMQGNDKDLNHGHDGKEEYELQNRSTNETNEARNSSPSSMRQPLGSSKYFGSPEKYVGVNIERKNDDGNKFEDSIMAVSSDPSPKDGNLSDRIAAETSNRGYEGNNFERSPLTSTDENSFQSPCDDDNDTGNSDWGERKSESVTAGDWGTSTTESSMEVAAALEHAQGTAANLTNWAGRAFRRAVVQHAMENGMEIPESAKPHAMNTILKSPLHSLTPETMEDGKSSTTTPRQDDPSRYGAEEKPTDNSKWFESVNEKFQTTVNNDPSLETNTPTQSDAFVSERGGEADGVVTDEMRAEVMQLLRLFGIPYVVAPAEAEAQCVELERLGLVDGIVTEDSDTFVFGGQIVYKNIFDDKKYVEVYHAKDASEEMNLNQDSLVALALLLGGDYTEGVKGVGIVNGMEILQAFDVAEDCKVGLNRFRQWLDGFDPLDLAQNGTKTSTDVLVTGVNTEKEKEFHRKHHTARNRWIAPKFFPDPKVLNAYLNPVVDNSREPFSWGTPDLNGLVAFCRLNMGWEEFETKKLIEPVIQQLEKGAMRQTRIDSFMRYEDGIKFAKIQSKRLRQVLGVSSKDVTVEGKLHRRKQANISRTGGEVNFEEAYYDVDFEEEDFAAADSAVQSNEDSSEHVTETPRSEWKSLSKVDPPTKKYNGKKTRTIAALSSAAASTAAIATGVAENANLGGGKITDKKNKAVQKSISSELPKTAPPAYQKQSSAILEEAEPNAEALKEGETTYEVINPSIL